jgi:hypothetical protein
VLVDYVALDTRLHHGAVCVVVSGESEIPLRAVRQEIANVGNASIKARVISHVSGSVLRDSLNWFTLICYPV